MTIPTKLQMSAGLLAYRRRPALEVLLAHPGGPYWRQKNDGAWTIPKGLIERESDPLDAARREFTEETGLVAEGPFMPLAQVRQKNGKTVSAWALESDFDLSSFASNTFEMEWPPRSGRMMAFPEIDRIAWFPMAQAALKIIAYQRPLLEALQINLNLDR